MNAASVAKKGLLPLVAVAALVLLLLWMQGAIGARKVAPGLVPLPATNAPSGSYVKVERRTVEDRREWAGTVRARTSADVAPRVMARVLEVRAVMGAFVKAGETLAALDDRDLRSRVEQARSLVSVAEAQAADAASYVVRIRALREKEAASLADLDASEARAKGTRADADRARDGLREAEVLLGDALLRAPFDGIVAERRVEPGDLAVPGRALFVVQDPKRLRLEADVPASCARGAALGAEVRVRIEPLEAELAATIEEVAPTADPGSGTFLVKAALPDVEGLKPGMFGRFLQPCGSHDAFAIPAGALSRIGQLESVLLRDGSGGAPRTRHVKTGKHLDGGAIEVLSGLAAGDEVLVPEVAR